MTDRKVLLICGPPGAGKSTQAQEIALEEGLDVFDLDDPKWDQSEKRFRAALRQLGRSQTARAVVIRSGASKSARTKAAEMVKATEVTVVETPAEVCRTRVVSRKRQPPPIKTQIAAVDGWWRRYEPGPVFFEGQATTDPSPSQISLPAAKGRRGRGKQTKASTNARGYGARHQKLRAKLVREVARGGVRCWRCDTVIAAGEDWDLGHDDTDRSKYRGPEHRRCNRATAGRRTRRWQSREW